MNRPNTLIAVFLISFALPLLSCGQKYWMTAKVCHGTMYVENFRLPTGEVANYLTDSTTFRFYVGIDDPEEKVFTYACKGDSIIIRKVTVPRQEGDRSKLLSTDIYSLRDLRRKDPIH